LPAASFSYWQRQTVRLFGVIIVNRQMSHSEPAVEQVPRADELCESGAVSVECWHRRGHYAAIQANKQRESAVV